MTKLDHSRPEIADDPDAHRDQMRGRLRAFEDKWLASPGVQQPEAAHGAG